jgi:ABC-type molybdate transport system ATPase subunit
MHGELLFDSAAPTPSVRVDLEARSPAIALTGPSGSGKSTLLRALATTSHHFTGTVRALGESWAGEDGRSKVSPWRRGIGWVPQDSLLFPHLTVAENLRFGRTQRPGPVDESALLTWLAIAHLLPRQPRHLSGAKPSGSP